MFTHLAFPRAGPEHTRIACPRTAPNDPRVYTISLVGVRGQFELVSSPGVEVPGAVSRHGEELPAVRAEG